MAREGRFIMRNVFTNQDMFNLLKGLYEENTFEVFLTDADTGVKSQADMVSYLNIQFYAWWEHLKTMTEEQIDNGADLRQTWRESLIYSMDKSFALVEQLNEEAIVSEDVDGGANTGRISFMIQSDKVNQLEYYLRMLKAEYLGKPMTIETLNGGKITGYLTLGILLYENEVEITQFGEVISCSINYKFSWLSNALTYSDISLSLSLDGTNYYSMPISKATWQNVFTTEAVPRANRVDLTGFIATAISLGVTLSFYDFNEQLNATLNEVFWQLGAYSIKDGNNAPIIQQTQNVNKMVYLKAKVGTKEYVYRCVMTGFDKSLQNNDFIVSTLVLKQWGKEGV